MTRPTRSTPSRLIRRCSARGAPKVKGGFDFVGDAYDASAHDGQPRAHPASRPESARLQRPRLARGRHDRRLRRQRRWHPLWRRRGRAVRQHDPNERVHDRAGRRARGRPVRAARLRLRWVVRRRRRRAIDWAVENDLDVINMSLGSPFGRSDDPSAAAASNAAAAGVIVVTSSGNSGGNPYITGSPERADGSISTAAVDSSATFLAAVLGLSTGASVTAINANGADLPAGPLPIHVLRNPDGTVSLGCNGIGAGRRAPPGQHAGRVRGAERRWQDRCHRPWELRARTARAVHASRPAPPPWSWSTPAPASRHSRVRSPAILISRATSIS